LCHPSKVYFQTLFSKISNVFKYSLVKYAHDTSNFVKAGKAYSIPSNKATFNIEVKGPVGKELVKAIATTEPIDVTGMDLGPTEGTFKSISKGTQFADELAQILASGLSKNSKDAAIPTDGWATDSIVLRVK